MMIRFVEMEPADVLAPHGVSDMAKVEQLAASMRAEGWQGAPLVAIINGSTADALCGSHRIEAASWAEIDIPVVDIADLAEEHGLDWHGLYERMVDEGTSYPGHEAATRLAAELPAAVVAYYGLDLH